MPMQATVMRTDKFDPLARFTDGAVVSRTRQPMPLKATRVNVRILGDALAIVSTERTFHNAEASTIEATITFPVPVHATLVGLSAKIGDRTVVGSAQRRQKARETYEGALDRGKTAVLHEEALKGVHMLSVGHVPAGAEVSATSVWAMPLAGLPEGGFLRIPTTVGDIFGRSPLSDSDDLAHGPVVHAADLEVSCDGRTVAVAGGDLVEGKARILLNAPIDILVHGATPRPLAGLAADGRGVTLKVERDGGGEGNIDAVLLADVSTSMGEPAAGGRGRGSEQKYDVMMRGLGNAAASLRPTDSIDLIQFNNWPTVVSGPGEPLVSSLNRLQGPSGGTAIGAAIGEALAGRETADVLLITDGKSHDIKVQEAARSGRRFTVVLIGEDALEANVGHLAALTGGQLFVAAGSDADVAIRQAFASLRRPHQAAPPIDGVPVRVVTHIGGMRISADWSTEASASAVPSDDERVIGAVAAALAVPRLQEEKATALAEAHGIVCHLTSLVLVDEAGAVQEGIPGQRKIPLMTPRTSAAPGLDVGTAGHGDLDYMSQSRGIGGVLRSASLAPSGAYAASATKGMFSRGGAWDEPPTQMGVSRSLSSASPSKSIFSSRDIARGIGGSDRGLPPITTSPAAPPARPEPFGSLKAAVGRIDWGKNPEALRRGETMGNIPMDVVGNLNWASRQSAVVELAAALGITAMQVAIGLVARADLDASGDRGARRLFQALLGSADAGTLARAMAAVGI